MMGGPPLFALARLGMTLGGTIGLYMLLGKCRFPRRKAAFLYALFYGALIVACTVWYIVDHPSFLRLVVFVCFLSSVLFNVFMTGDKLSVTLFNLSIQFFLVCIIMIFSYWVTTGLFNGSIWVDVLIRLLLFAGIGALYLRRLREPFRKVVESPYADWSFFAVVALFVSLLFPLYVVKPVMFLYRSRQEQIMAAGFAILLVLMFVLVFKALGHMLREAAGQREKELITLSSRLLRHQLDLQESAMAEARRIRHDVRHHNAAIAEYARRGDLEGLLRYLDQAARQIDDLDLCAYCANPAVNNILAVYVRRARQAGIKLSLDLAVPRELPLSETDLVVLLANLLENAIEGCQRVEGGDPGHIALRAQYQGGRLLLQVQNTCLPAIAFNAAGLPVSQKESGVGAGSILKLAEKYGGHATFQAQDGQFTARVLLNL